MKEIIIDNKDLIEKELQKVQGKAYERIIDHDKIKFCTSKVEEELLSLGIEKKYWDDIRIHIGPDLYQITGIYSKMCSFATLIYRKRKWRLIEIERRREWKKSANSRITYEVETFLTQTAKSRVKSPKFNLR